ncbi:MAG: hypothetical protein ACOCX0_00700 [Bacteroidota bacterium]
MKKFLFLLFLAVTLSVHVSGQEIEISPKPVSKLQTKKHTLGLQLNPWIGKNNPFRPDLNRFLVLGNLRYGYHILPDVVVGGELMSTYQQYSRDRYYYNIGLGAYGQYWFFQWPNIRLGVEAHVFANTRSYTLDKSNYTLYELDLFRSAWDQQYHIGYFVSPVVSLNKKQSRWSFDLMYKFTHKEIPGYWNKSVFSYRISYHF